MDISSAINFGIQSLAHLENPKLETEMLLSNVLKKDRIFLKTNPDFNISSPEKEKFELYIAQRSENIPMAYILGYKDWDEFRITVTSDTLIPRDETEILCGYIVADVIANNTEVASFSLLDIGTGSGCIPIFISKKCRMSNVECRMTALDISEGALAVARKNFKNHGVAGECLVSDLLSAVEIGSHFDIITANLPYVPADSPVAKDLSYEPSGAIFSGIDGLDHIRRLAEEVAHTKITFGALWLEFLPRQQKPIAAIFEGYRIDFLTDVGGEVFFAKIYPHV